MRIFEELIFVWVIIVGAILLGINEVFPNDYIVIIYGAIGFLLVFIYGIMLVIKGLIYIKQLVLKLIQ